MLTRKMMSLLITFSAIAAVILAGSPPCRADSGQQTFSSPAAAAEALAQAAATNDEAAAQRIFGPDATQITTSGDPVADKAAAQKFAERYRQMHRLAYNSDNQVILYLGADNWPFPIPLVKQGDNWIFDTAAGKQELVYRRIGTNELFTIATMRELAAAEDEYMKSDHQYAAKLKSDSGTHDGLFWNAAASEKPSPIGPLVANASADGYRWGTEGQPAAFHGYLYRMLSGQGKDAAGGSKEYAVDGNPVAGFAVVAYPAEYRSSGVMTFLINQDGTLYEKDLGADTDKIAKSMTEFDPDKSWQEVAEFAGR
jgi:hypothetical protein